MNRRVRALRRWKLGTFAGHAFLAVAGWGSALGDALGLPALVGLPLGGAVGFGLLMLFHRAVRRAVGSGPDESRLLGFLLPAIVPFLRPLVELGLLQSAARITIGATGADRIAPPVAALTWGRVALDLIAWGALLFTPGGPGPVAAGASALSLVLLGVVLHLVTAPLLERDAGRAAPPALHTGGDEPVAVVAVEGLRGAVG